MRTLFERGATDYRDEVLAVLEDLRKHSLAWWTANMMSDGWSRNWERVAKMIRDIPTEEGQRE